MSYETNIDVNNEGMKIDFDKYEKYIVNGKVHIAISKPKTEKTLQQMKALRALISAFFFSGASSCPEDIKDIDSFTIWIKLQIDFYIDMLVHGQSIRVVKSLANASKEQMTDAIEKILKIIDMAGAKNDDKIQEIIIGMKENKLF